MYGAACLDWPPWRKEEAFEDLKGVWCWNMLQGGEYFAGLGAEGLYNLAMEATRDAEFARELAMRRATSRQCRGDDP